LAYRFTDEEQKQIVWPKRVQILIDEYLTAGRQVNPNLRLDYQIETIDQHEKLFDDRAKQKPETLKILINSIYRVKTQDNEEYFFYSATKTCKNALNNPERPFTYDQYGYHKRPIVTLRWNETTQKSDPYIGSYAQGFELKWDKNEVKKLLDKSPVPCHNFYIDHAGNTANEPIGDHRYQIFNLDDFLDGSFEELISLGRYGLSGPKPSLYLLEAAEEQEKEKRKAEAVKRVKAQTSLQQ
jgi:hypothetical protein